MALSFLDSLPPACEVLRPYQRQQLADVAGSLRSGVRRLLVQLPTGGGKTVEIGAIVLAASLAGLRVLILATRTRLVSQIRERLDTFDVRYGVIAASLPALNNAAMGVQVASADTLYRRCVVDERRPLPAADIVIFDEAHLAVADSRLKVLDSYPDAIRLGFSATPARKSGRGLGAAFEQIVAGPTIGELIAMGMLVRPRIFNTPIVSADELKALPKTAGDFSEGALGALLARPKLVGDVVSNWLRLAAGRRTVIFACNKAHGQQLTQELCRTGVAAELLTDQDEEDQREAVIARLEAGTTTVVVNCFLMSYGTDIPAVECIVLARPTRSLVMYLQMIGRGLRPAPGKDHCLVIDHGRCVENLGLPTSDHPWSLDEARNVNRDASERMSRRSVTEKPRTCPECAHMWLVSELGNACTQCGWVPSVCAKAIGYQEAELTELDEQNARIRLRSPEVSQFFGEALCWYLNRWPDRWREKPKSGRWWAWSKARERFKLGDVQAPKYVWEGPPLDTSHGTSGWLKSRQIAWAKRRSVAA